VGLKQQNLVDNRLVKIWST